MFRLRWFLATLLCTVACSGPAGTEHAGARHGGELRVWTEAVEVRWDPLQASDVISAAVVGQLYEGLVGYRPGRGGELFPVAAESFVVGDRGLTYTFTLRPEARFHDDICFPGGRGRALRSTDVRFTIERALREREQPGGQVAIWRIHGARAFRAGRSAHPEGIEILDDRTVRFHLTRPTPDFLHLLASQAGWLVPPEAVAAYGSDLAEHPVGSGPFRLGRYLPGRVILLVANPHYWGRDAAGRRLPYLDSVALFGADWVERHSQEPLHFIPINAAPGEAGSPAVPGLRIHRVPRLNTIFVSWNMRRPSPWTRDVRLRRAVALALGCIDLRNRVWIRSRAGGLLPPELPGHRAAPRDTCAVERARALLREAGYPGGAGLEPLPFDLIERWDGFIGQQVRERLAPIGVRVVLRPAGRRQHWRKVHAGRSLFFRDGWMADYPAPANFLQCYLSGAPSNNSGFRSARFDSLYEAAEAEGTAARRAAIYRSMDELLLDELPSVFLYHEYFTYYVAEQVRAPEALLNSFERRFYEWVWLADEAGAGVGAGVAAGVAAAR